MATYVKEKDLRSYIARQLFEYTVTNFSSLHDRPLAQGEEIEDNEDTTVPSEVPLTPVQLTSSQLADERPPVEDPEYVPSSGSELAKAAKVLAGLVPLDQVEVFYKELHRLLDDTVEKSRSGSLKSDDNEDFVPGQEDG